MKMNVLFGKHVRIGKSSITVKNPKTGKTVGMVTNICKFKDLQANKQISYSKILRETGLWGCGIDGVIDAVIIADNQLYYLNNMKPIEMYNKYFCEEMFVNERKTINKRIEIAENMKQYATVIDCYIE